MKRAQTQLAVDPAKVRKAQKILGAKTASEAVERALDEVLRNALLDRRHNRLVESGVEVEDIFGRLAR
jgi:Arc/MetJ family transcription regulator